WPPPGEVWRSASASTRKLFYSIPSATSHKRAMGGERAPNRELFLLCVAELSRPVIVAHPNCRCPLWVKTRKSHAEQITSASLSKADKSRPARHVSLVPKGDQLGCELRSLVSAEPA